MVVVVEAYPSAELQSVYSTAQVDWAMYVYEIFTKYT